MNIAGFSCHSFWQAGTPCVPSGFGAARPASQGFATKKAWASRTMDSLRPAFVAGHRRRLNLTFMRLVHTPDWLPDEGRRHLGCRVEAGLRWLEAGGRRGSGWCGGCALRRRWFERWETAAVVSPGYRPHLLRRPRQALQENKARLNGSMSRAMSPASRRPCCTESMV
jgi:hypothetical protein